MERLKIVKMTILFDVFYNFNVIFIELLLKIIE